MYDLSVIIAGRNEEFFAHTVAHVLDRIRANTEVIAICDGDWPTPPILDHPRLTVVKHDSIGQRAATNEGARISQAKYIMKLDAHCAVAKGFDNALIQDYQPGWTLIPIMYNLHAFDWKCQKCGYRVYQGARPKKCDECGEVEFEKLIVWQRRKNRLTQSWRFDSDLHFQYWHDFMKRPEAKEKIYEIMSCIGCNFFIDRERFWRLGGMDESHGSWGQYGTELACKAWLSGGKMMATKSTWIAHMFRTDNFREDGKSAFPYPITNKDISKARSHSKDYWRNNRMPNQVNKLSWLIEKFWPVPGWEEEDLKKLKDVR